MHPLITMLEAQHQELMEDLHLPFAAGIALDHTDAHWFQASPHS